MKKAIIFITAMILVGCCPPGGVGDYAGLLWKGATYACPCDTSEAARFVAVNLPL
jgi:hypothetical protein